MDTAVHYVDLVARQYRQRSRGRRIASGAIAGIVIGCVVFVLAALLCCWFCCCRKRRSKRQAVHAQPSTGGGFMSRFRPNRQHQVHPGMQEAGYGGAPAPHTGYGYAPQAPRPAYR
ncbi:hypothetical protein HJFPF1_02325 [Paramyrothecium foliicola]|nr:hypothetical protein HJFPF1_02325 [Paramyrothecium foliicola]